MRAKLFGLFLLLLGVAVAASLFKSSSRPEGGPIDVDVPGTENNDPVGAKGPTSRLPSPVKPVDKGDGEPTRTARDGVGDVIDHSGTLIVSGVVTDKGSGAPVPEAEIELLYPDGDEIDSATSDAAGRYRIEVVEGIPSMIAFRVSADGYASHTPVMRRMTEVAGKMVTMDFALTRAFTIRGRVTAAKDGMPVEDADIEVRCLHPLFEDTWEDATTNEEGVYETPEITDVPRSGIDVWVDSSDFAPMVKRDITVPDGQNVLTVDFVLWESLTLVGTVVSSVTGQPIEDAEVSIASRDPEFIDDGEDELTEEDGTFEMELDTIPYENMFVLVSADDHAARKIAEVPAPDRDGVIRLGTIALGPAVTIRGLVRNARTGAAVRGGDVYVYSTFAPDLEDGDYVDNESIDQTGRFEITLTYAPPQGAEIYVDPVQHEAMRVPLDVPLNVLEHEMVIDVQPVIILRGAVRRTRDSSPIPGAGVRVLLGTESEEEPYTRCRADGSFRVSLPAGDLSRYSVVIEAGADRFPVGNLENPEGGRNEVVREFKVDLPPR